MAALIALALGVVSTLGRVGVRSALVPAGAGLVGAGVGAELSGGGPFPGFFGLPFGPGTRGSQRRRRRRKALTNTDMALALTIASAISKKAAENFILIRVRGS